MKYSAFFISAALGLFATSSGANTQEVRWVIDTPYHPNPLKTATLQGEAQFQDQQGPAWLVLSCRPDAPDAQLTLRVANNVIRHFPVGDFEGPGAAGERTPGVRIQSLELEHGQAWTSSGWYQEESFNWTITPTSQALSQWLHGKDHRLQVVISQMQPGQPPLTARFLLPDESHLADQVIQPCEQ